MSAPTARPLLDRWIEAAHQATSRAGTHPHQVSWGVAVLGLPLSTGGIGLFLAERPWVPAVGVLLVLVSYHAGYLPVKRVCFPGARRQLLMDLALFCLPVFLAFTLATGESLRAMTDLCALVLPWGVVTLRLGCLLGGCCQGRPAAWGVLHPGHSERRIPLPLFEVLLGASLAVGLPLSALLAEGPLLPRFAVVYAGWRVISECFRAADVERTLGLTPSQIVAAGVVVLGGLAW